MLPYISIFGKKSVHDNKIEIKKKNIYSPTNDISHFKVFKLESLQKNLFPAPRIYCSAVRSSRCKLLNPPHPTQLHQRRRQSRGSTRQQTWYVLSLLKALSADNKMVKKVNKTSKKSSISMFKSLYFYLFFKSIFKMCTPITNNLVEISHPSVRPEISPLLFRPCRCDFRS